MKWCTIVAGVFLLLLGCATAVQKPAVKPSMTGHLLTPTEAWQKVYPDAEPNEAKLYYTLAVLIEANKREIATIKELNERVAVLEKKAGIVADPNTSVKK